MTYTAVDVQGFAGGFTLGMVQAGFELVGKREMQAGFGVANCEANRHLLGHNWKSEMRAPENWTPVDAHVVFGNPPCSGFSVMSAKTFRGASSKINHCMWAFAEYAGKVKPLIAAFESVQVARTSVDGLELMRALRADVERRTGEQYTLYHVRHNALEVGGAAERKRYFWVIARIPFGIHWEPIARKPVMRDIIGDLETQPHTWAASPYTQTGTWWTDPRRSGSGAVDGHSGLDNPLTRRMIDLMSGIDWREGDHIAAVAKRYYEKYGKLPASWAASEAKLVANDFFMGYTSPVRWHAERPGRVVTGGGLHNVVHYDQPRTITHREAARILGFPDDWLIEPLKGVSGLNMTWGKGITVDCGRWIGKQMIAALDGNPGDYVGDVLGDREYDINLTHGMRERKPQSPGIVTTRVKIPKMRSYPMSDETPGRGRPRPANTIERDDKVLAILNETIDTGLTRGEIAEKLGVTGSEAYLSLYRLSRGGKIVKAGNHWKVNGSAPAEAAPASEDVLPVPPAEFSEPAA
jgi:site-specific DNA-cytosine methylase